MISGWECDHSDMSECHDGCGHFLCPCGITWDESFEGKTFEYDTYEQWIMSNDPLPE